MVSGPEGKCGNSCPQNGVPRGGLKRSGPRGYPPRPPRSTRGFTFLGVGWVFPKTPSGPSDGPVTWGARGQPRGCPLFGGPARVPFSFPPGPPGLSPPPPRPPRSGAPPPLALAAGAPPRGGPGLGPVPLLGLPGVFARPPASPLFPALPLFGGEKGGEEKGGGGGRERRDMGPRFFYS